MEDLTGVRVWMMPVHAEILDKDGRQIFYATEDGGGSVIDCGTVTSWSVTYEDEPT